MNNPQYDNYPEGVYKNVTIEAKMDDDGVWSVYCPQWQCELHDKNLTRCVAGLVAEIEAHNDGELAELKRYNPDSKLRFKQGKRKDWTGNTICEATAMEPRNVRSGYIGWNL